uniref:Uncharacterized protein n=1 Tax=Anguilla anguilla TaxID=7936 RepID=A0A0E9UMR4_ANGAN
MVKMHIFKHVKQQTVTGQENGINEMFQAILCWSL